MTFPRVLRSVLFLLLCAAPLSACAVQCRPVVEGGWIRKPPAELPMLAGYARISNQCDAPVVVVSASSPAFEEVSVHATVVEGGISKMRPINELRIAPGKTAVLEPGGLHLMLMQPKQALAPGDTVEVEFTLADGRTLRGRFEVKGPKAVP